MLLPYHAVIEYVIVKKRKTGDLRWFYFGSRNLQLTTVRTHFAAMARCWLLIENKIRISALVARFA